MKVIILHGSPGNGKKTISGKLQEHFKSPWFEFKWIPGFGELDPYCEMNGKDKEQMTFETLVFVVRDYINHNFENIILSDLIDERLLDIPVVFRNKNYIIFTLYSEDDDVIKNRILNRNNGNDYKTFEESIMLNRMIINRKVLPNEYRIRSDNQTPDEILSQIIDITGKHKCRYDYEPDEYQRSDYYSYTD
jgi:dephospho-CoA kinase